MKVEQAKLFKLFKWYCWKYKSYNESL